MATSLTAGLGHPGSGEEGEVYRDEEERAINSKRGF